MKKRIEEKVVFTEDKLGNGSDEAIFRLMIKTIENLLICREFVDGPFVDKRRVLNEK